MGTRTIVNVTWPVAATSLLLLCLGVLAAWWVDKTQSDNSLLIAQEVHGILSAQDLYAMMRESRRSLDLFLRTRNGAELDKIQAHRSESQELLNQAKRSARTPTEKELIEVVEQGYTHFYSEYRRIRSIEFTEHQEQGLSNLVDHILTKEVLEPAQKFVDYNRQVIDSSNQALKETANRIRIGFILLGLCGALAGMALGILVAVNLRRKMIKLHVSVQGVAGRLNEVLGPVTLPEGTTMQELQVSLQRMEQHIADVVQRVQKQELEILRREQLASLGQMAAGMAHELRNPLMPMKMLVQSEIQKGDSGPGLRGRSLQVVNEEIEKLETSIQAFLDFARPPQLEQTSFDMSELCDRTLELVSARASQQDVQLILHWPEYPICVHADSGQMRQVVLNLVLNSLDAMPQGGTVEVRVAAQTAGQIAGEVGQPEVKMEELALVKPGVTVKPLSDHRDFDRTRKRFGGSSKPRTLEEDWCVVTVQDTGIGMPPEVVDRIFEPFVTTKETGHGLGLSTCLRVIQAHGGTISAMNPPQGGCCVTFRLRVAKETFLPNRG